MKLWPESSHKPLLRATFLSGSAAITAWQQWLDLIDIQDHPDPGSHRLLPHLFHNMRDQGIDHPIMMRLRGIVRKSWTYNKHTLDTQFWPWSDFKARGIDFILLPGAATAMKYYSHYVLVPPKETAILIHPKDLSVAARLLKTRHWQPEDKLIDRHGPSPRDYNTRWQDSEGRRLRLYWRPNRTACRAEAVQSLFKVAETVEQQDLSLKTLRPIDHILWTSSLDLYGRFEPLFVRAAETMLIIRAADAVNWPELAEEAHKQQLRKPLVDVLYYLHQRLDLPLPAGYLQNLGQPEDLTAEARLLAYNQPQTGGWRKALGLWMLHQHCSDKKSRLTHMLTFPRFLQQTWRLNSLWQVPLHPPAVLLRRFYHFK